MGFWGGLDIGGMHDVQREKRKKSGEGKGRRIVVRFSKAGKRGL